MNKIKMLLTMVILINAEILSAAANFRGTASGIFVNPYGNGSYEGVGTDTFSYGNSGGQNQLSFQGTQFNVHISTPGGYIFGSAAQSNRPSFSLGTLSYRNARTKGSPKGVYLDVDVQLTSPIGTNTKTISTKLDFEMTPNDGDKYHNADYVHLYQTFAPITLHTQGGVPITIEPFGFSTTGINAFTNIHSFHVFEDESASAELLARITSPCESIVRNAVKTYVEDGHEMWAVFQPNFNLSIDEAAKLCGYRAFNWVQYVVDDPYSAGLKLNSGKKLGKMYVDPPRGDYADSDSDGKGNFPYYLDPTNTNIQDHFEKNELYFSDIPRDKDMKPNQPIKFVTQLVGLKHNDQYDVLYAWKWQTTWDGGNSGGVSIRSMASHDNVGTGGTGGITVTKKDLSAIDIPFNVRKLMQDTGAANVETYADLLPLPILFPVLF